VSTSSKPAGRSKGQVLGILAGLVVVLGVVQYSSASSDNTYQANGYTYTVSGADAPVADGYSEYPVYAAPPVETVEPAAPITATPITQAWLDANHARVEAVAKAAIERAKAEAEPSSAGMDNDEMGEIYGSLLQSTFVCGHPEWLQRPFAARFVNTLGAANLNPTEEQNDRNVKNMNKGADTVDRAVRGIGKAATCKMFDDQTSR
jgi:hypothetical protein